LPKAVNKYARYRRGLARSEFPTSSKHALDDPIAILPLVPFHVALVLHGDPTGEGAEALLRFLRQADVLLVDGISMFLRNPGGEVGRAGPPVADALRFF